MDDCEEGLVQWLNLVKGRRGFGGRSFEHLAGDHSAPKDPARHQQESCEEVPRHVTRSGREER